MRLSLLYNPTAGEGLRLQEICELLKRHGHSIVQILEQHDIRETSIAGDALVTAGGDGTVGAGARIVASGQTPIAILPRGTANNIAKSLGIDGPLDQIVERWWKEEPRSVDLGFAGGPWGVRRFIESVGAGLIAQGIVDADLDRHGATESGKRTVLEGAHGYLETLGELKPVRAVIVADGETIEGEFLLVELLNVPLVGSNLHLTGDADPGDGLLSIVSVDTGQHDALYEYLAHHADDCEIPAPFVARKAAHVDLTGWPGVHVDDAFQPVDGSGRVSVEIDPGALLVL